MRLPDAAAGTARATRTTGDTIVWLRTYVRCCKVVGPSCQVSI